MKRSSAVLGILIAVLFTVGFGDAYAGLINVNLGSSDSVGNDGNGPLGGGTWNRVNLATANAGATALVKSDGSPTGITIQHFGTNPGAVIESGQNAVQLEAWIDFTDTPLVQFTGFSPIEMYEIVVYCDRGAVSMSGSHNIQIYDPNFLSNTQSKSILEPGNAFVPMPGVEGTDYVRFLMNPPGPSPAGVQFVVAGQRIAGIQIRGIMDNELGPQIDGVISARRNLRKAKGNNFYSLGKSKKQGIVQKTTGPKRVRYFVGFQNDGIERDQMYMMIFAKKRQAKVKVRDRTMGGNATVQGLLRNYRYFLSPGKTHLFQVVIRPRGNKRKILTQICGSPSTLQRAKQDCVNCILRR